MKSVTACKDILNSRTLNANAVCATCNKCLVDSNHFACVTKMLNDVNARTKKPNIVPISTRKPKSQANKSVATSHKKKVASKSNNQKPQSYFRMMYEKTSKAWKWWIEQQSPSGYKWVPKAKIQWVPKAKMQWVPKAKNKMCRKDLCQFLVMEIWFKEMSRSTGFIMSKASITISSQLVNFMMRIWRLLSGSQHVLLKIFRATLTQAWLWHQRLSHLNFDYINLLSKKDIVIGLPNLKGTEFLNKTLNAFFKEEGIEHQTSTARTHEQNGIVKRRNRTLVEAAQTMLSASKLPLFFWAKAITTACYTQNRSIIIPTHDKTPYHIINDRKPSIKHLHIFYAHVPSQQELDLLFGPLYDEYFNACSNPQEKQPSMNIQSTSAPSTQTYVHAEENTNHQAEEGEHLQDDEFTNPFCAPAQEAESSSHNIGNSNVPTFNQP
uniref:Retrovirus-related Pol polyprotein from transposon TNT 1-94 n=1 Tax=Tanacetum cinerariifolium TaxID=118510 RepID=A0A699J3Q7_TANCI|nr:retrovirus-related Pol polyprotein from transposon TNT 1-94 [Tanacetum cinerariifolium]